MSDVKIKRYLPVYVNTENGAIVTGTTVYNSLSELKENEKNFVDYVELDGIIYIPNQVCGAV